MKLSKEPTVIEKLKKKKNWPVGITEDEQTMVLKQDGWSKCYHSWVLHTQVTLTLQNNTIMQIWPALLIIITVKHDNSENRAMIYNSEGRRSTLSSKVKPWPKIIHSDKYKSDGRSSECFCTKCSWVRWLIRPRLKAWERICSKDEAGKFIPPLWKECTDRLITHTHTLDFSFFFLSYTFAWRPRMSFRNT